MAEPLTSSDIIRERLGFGPTSPDEKRRAVDAGISPLDTMDRIRFQEGRGISSMASKSDRDAWVAAEVMAGRRDPMELPKSYGGLGERPEATTRRQFRMQQEWDKQYAMVKAEQEAARQIEESERDYALRLQDQQNKAEEERSKRDADLARVSREAKIREQARNIREAFIGTTLPDGRKTLPIDLNDDNAAERIQRTVYMNDLGMEDQATKEMASMFLNDALRFREKRSTELAEQAKADAAARVSISKDLAQNGLSIAEFSEGGKVDFEKANVALGEALKKKEEGKEPAMDEREMKRSLRRQKATAETELVKIKAKEASFQKRFDARNTSDNRTELEAAQIERGIFEDEINRINRELGEEPQPAAPTPAGQRPALGDIFGGQ